MVMLSFSGGARNRLPCVSVLSCATEQQVVEWVYDASRFRVWGLHHGHQDLGFGIRAYVLGQLGVWA